MTPTVIAIILMLIILAYTTFYNLYWIQRLKNLLYYSFLNEQVLYYSDVSARSTLNKMPNRGTPKSAGIDIYVPHDFETKTIPPNGHILIESNIAFKIPENYCLVAMNKGSIASKRNLIIGACLIDEDYQDSIKIHLYNPFNNDAIISPGDKITQVVLIPTIYPELIYTPYNELFTEESVRGKGAFGSTGSK